MTSPLGVGLVGCGGISSHYVRLLTSFEAHIRVVAVCDVVEERAAERSAQFVETYRAKGVEAAAPRVFTDFERLVRHAGVQLVVVATPPAMHAPVSLAGLEAGRHVFSEGPMAAHLRDADAVIEASRRQPGKLSVQYCTRFFREARQAKLAVSRGLLGKIALGRVDASWHWGMEFYRDTKFGRNRYRGTFSGEGGGSAYHHGRYASDLFLHLMGEPVIEVAALTGTLLHEIETEDVSSAALRFQSGAIGHVTTTICAHRNEAIPYDRVELFGERASLQVCRGIDWRTAPAQPHFGLSIASADATYAEEVRAQLDQLVPATGEDMQVAQFRQFLDAIEQDLAPPVSPESARAHVELVRATYKSARTRTAVSLPLGAADPFYGPDGTAG